jgi:hypothetical protein
MDVGLVLCSILDQILFSGCDLILMIGTITTEMICMLKKINLYL